MTLILSAGNEDYVVLAADQRLTRADAAGNLSLFDSKSNKMTLLTTRDAQVAVAYTGLASVNIPPGHSGPPPPRGFSTPYWIVDTLSRCAEPDRLLEPTLERLRDAAEAEFTRQALRVKDAPLEIVIAGYRYVDPSSLERFLIRHKLSNVEGTTSSGNGPFVISDPNEGTGASFVMSAGTVTALEDSDVSFLRETVDTPGFAPGATIDRLAHTIRLVAGRPASKSAIGSECTTIYVPSNPAHPTFSNYFPMLGEESFHGVNEVRALAERSESVMDVIVASGDGSLFVGPKIGRNKPCWCGSGKKFKRCHGR